MAAMRPEMEKVQNKMKADPNIDSMEVKLRYQTEMKALFTVYKVNPLRALMWPFVQFPIFIGLFMALRDMGLHYPDMATGGTLWFTDLTAADPYYILPIFNSLSFLAMIEMGSDGMNADQKGPFKWMMRGMAVIMIPVTLSMPSVNLSVLFLFLLY